MASWWFEPSKGLRFFSFLRDLWNPRGWESGGVNMGVLNEGVGDQSTGKVRSCSHSSVWYD